MERRPLRSADIRARNEKLVLSIIRGRRGVSQSEVAQLTGLKPPTVFRIFQVLAEQEFIVSCPEGETGGGREEPSSDGGGERKGRRPAYYCVNRRARYAIGLDFWARSASAVVVDFAGTPIYRKVLAFDEHEHEHRLRHEERQDGGSSRTTAQETVDRLMQLLSEAMEAAGIDERQLLGIGVGAPGMVDIREGVVVRYPRIPGMDGYPLQAELQKRFGVPVHLHNNAAVIALSEYRYGSVRGRQSVLTLVVRAGVGGAFIQDGTLFVNQDRTALEVGHTTVDPAGPQCRCGRHGCLETYLSEEALRRDAGAADIDAFFAAVAQGEVEALSVVQRAAEKLLIALYGLLNSFNPEAVLIVTRSDALSRRLSDAIRDQLVRQSPFVTAAERDIVPHAYDPVIAGQGAADLVFDSFFATVEA